MVQGIRAGNARHGTSVIIGEPDRSESETEGIAARACPLTQHRARVNGASDPNQYTQQGWLWLGR